MSDVLMRWVFRGNTLALALYRADDIRIFIATPFVSALVVTVLVSIRAVRYETTPAHFSRAACFER